MTFGTHANRAGEWPSDESATPLLSWRGAGAAFLLSVLLCWPMLVVPGPLVFFDTLPYLGDGSKVWRLALDLLEIHPYAAPEVLPGPGQGTAEAGTAAATVPDPGEGVRQLRSSIYSLFVYLSSRLPTGLVLTVVLQTTMTLLALFALIPRAALSSPRRISAAILFMAALTTLPWHASYAMPDLLAAGVVLCYAILADRGDVLGWGWRVAFLALATFAVSSHYGYIPLAAGLAVTVVALRLWRRRLAIWHVAFAVLPVVLTMAVNLVGSQAVVGEASIAPKRLPILLARSIADGPAHDYLLSACPEARDLEICRIMPEIPDTIQSFLFSTDGIEGLTSNELDQIRDEEATILWRSFLAYPLRQSEALFGNALRQIVAVGTDELYPPFDLDMERWPPFRFTEENRAEYAAFDVFDIVVKIGTALGFALALWFAVRRSYTRPEGVALIVCLAGILGNALIFGGLSAPVDRYQSRLIWIVPALALVTWMRQARTASDTATPIPRRSP